MNFRNAVLCIWGNLGVITVLFAFSPFQVELGHPAIQSNAILLANQPVEEPIAVQIPSITTTNATIPTPTPSPVVASGSDIYWVDQMTKDETGNWLPPEDVQEQIVADFKAIWEAELDVFFASDPPDLALIKASYPDWYSGEVLEFYQDNYIINPTEWEECSYQVSECSQDGLECKVIYRCSNGTSYHFDFETGEMTSLFDAQTGTLVATFRYDTMSGTWKIHKHFHSLPSDDSGQADNTPTPGSDEELITPGDKIGKMTVENSLFGSITLSPRIWDFCEDLPDAKEPLLYTSDCSMAFGKYGLSLSNGWGAINEPTLMSNWDDMNYELFIDGYKVDLERFYWFEEDDPSIGPDAWSFTWFVYLQPISPGKHTFRFVRSSEVPIDNGFDIYQPGEYEHVVNLTVAEPVTLGIRAIDFISSPVNILIITLGLIFLVVLIGWGLRARKKGEINKQQPDFKQQRPERPKSVSLNFFWGTCFLLGGLSIIFIGAEVAYQRYDASYQQRRLDGWTIYPDRQNLNGVNTSSNSFRSGPKEFVDQIGRIWNRDYYENYYAYAIRVEDSNGDHWLTLTHENSGLGKYDIKDLVVDDNERLWVLMSDDVRMIPISNLEPISDEYVYLRNIILDWREATAGYIWLLPTLLAVVLLAKYLNLMPGVLLAVSVGAFSLLIGSFLGFGPIIPLSLGYKAPNPVVVATFSGVIGGLIGGNIDNKRDKNNRTHKWSFILAMIGLVIGFGIGYGWLMFMVIATTP